ncbi:MAG: AAA family ATPase [Myxococcales bacterium]|jgi:hypothetical protein
MQPLDGRADLYALGVVLYRMLTGRYPYRARSVGELPALWQEKPTAPHLIDDSIPEGLSELAMTLIAREREARPRDAGEVMQRLASLGDLQDAESMAAAHAYLVTPALVGRAMSLRRMRLALGAALNGAGRGLIFAGPPGVGRSRLLHATALEAKLRGATVIRLDSQGHGDEPFAAAREVLSQLEGIDPERVLQLRRASAPGTARRTRPPSTPPSTRELQRLEALADFVRVVGGWARDTPLVLIGDDLHRIDEPSVAAVATLLQYAEDSRLFFAGSLPSAAEGAEPDGTLAITLLLRRSTRVELKPLSARAVRHLTRSVFGAVPHVGGLAARLHRVGGGLPREVMALAEHLLATDTIRHHRGQFVLPAKIPADALPDSLAGALRSRVDALTPRARVLGRALALGELPGISPGEARTLLPDASATQVRLALDDLMAADALEMAGDVYALRHAGWASAFLRDLDGAERTDCHALLARLFRAAGDDPLSEAYHARHAGDHARCEALLSEFCDAHPTVGAEVFELTALSQARFFELLDGVAQEALHRDAATVLLSQVAYMLMVVGAFRDARAFYAYAPRAESELKAMAGWDHYQRLDGALEPMQRALQAIQLAQADYEAGTSFRRFSPPDAIRHLVMYAVVAIAVGARTMDAELRRGLPALLAPFRPLSPLVDAMYENCVSAAESTVADYEGASERLRPVVAALSSGAAAQQEHADEIRAACIYAIAAYRARLGIPDDECLLDAVADHPRQSSSVLRTRAGLALNVGDWDAARAHLQAAEQRDLELDAGSMFGLVAVVPMVNLYARGFDLSMVTQLMELIRPLSERFAGWRTAFLGVLGEQHRLRGDSTEALAAFDECARRCEPDNPDLFPDGPFYEAETGALEILLERGELETCHARARRALSFGGGRPEGARFHGIQRALALCEARMGDADAAHARLDRLIDQRERIGTRGVQLGLLYEARALVAMHQGDTASAWRAYGRAHGEMMPAEGRGFARRLTHLRGMLERGEGVADRAAPWAFVAPSQQTRTGRAEATLADALEQGAGAAHITAMLDDFRRSTGCASCHLYRLTPDGARWVAASGARTPPETLHGFVEAQYRLDRAAVATEPSTAVRTETAVAETTGSDPHLTPLETSTFIDESGDPVMEYRLMWLRSQRQGGAAPPMAAVAVGDPPEPDAIATRVGG